MENFKVRKLAQMFDMLGDINRLNIVIYLVKGKQNVTNITKHVGMSQSAVSHQLRLLKDANILKSEKIGKTVYYDINDEHVDQILSNGLIHMMHEEVEYEKHI